MGHFGLTNTQLFSAIRSLGHGDPLETLKAFFSEDHTPSRGRDDSHILLKCPLRVTQLVRSVPSSPFGSTFVSSLLVHPLCEGQEEYQRITLRSVLPSFLQTSAFSLRSLSATCR